MTSISPLKEIIKKGLFGDNEGKKDNEIVKIKGDWTKPNKKIEQFLQKYNRFGIPFNIIYSKSYPDGIIFSELLSTSELIETINKINKRL